MAEDVKLYRYYVREKPRWEGAFTSLAIVVLGSDGFFSTISDYGNYSYGWWRWGSGDFRQFILDLCRKPGENEYLMSKLGKRDELDTESTVQLIREVILESRRRGGWDSEKARDEWELAESLESGGLDLRDWQHQTKISDSWEYGTHRYDVSLRMFVEHILPILGDAIEAELAAEATPQPSEAA